MSGVGGGSPFTDRPTPEDLARFSDPREQAARVLNCVGPGVSWSGALRGAAALAELGMLRPAEGIRPEVVTLTEALEEGLRSADSLVLQASREERRRRAALTAARIAEAWLIRMTEGAPGD